MSPRAPAGPKCKCTCGSPSRPQRVALKPVRGYTRVILCRCKCHLEAVASATPGPRPRGLVFSAEVRLDQALGLNGRLHWAKLRERLEPIAENVGYRWLQQDSGARKTLRAWPAQAGAGPFLAVTLTRSGPAEMDDDNNAGVLKHVRDVLARLLEVDDGDVRVRWTYAQRVGPWGLEVDVQGVSS